MEDEDDAEQLRDELSALKAIYGDERVDIVCSDRGETRMCSVRLLRAQDGDCAGKSCESHEMRITFLFPEGYPSRCFVNVVIEAPWLNREERDTLVQRLTERFMIEERRGDVLGYEICEWLREDKDAWLGGPIIHTKMTASTSDVRSKASQRYKDQSNSEFEDIRDMEILHGPKIQDRKSIFQAHMARVFNISEVNKFMAQLTSNDKKIAGATHNIMAYRLSEGGSDCDDDGESAAGSRLLHLLSMTDAIDIIIVVSRWFGGIHLGPDRFKHINNAARLLMDANGCIQRK